MYHMFMINKKIDWFEEEGCPTKAKFLSLKKSFQKVEPISSCNEV